MDQDKELYGPCHHREVWFKESNEIDTMVRGSLGRSASIDSHEIIQVMTGFGVAGSPSLPQNTFFLQT